MLQPGAPIVSHGVARLLCIVRYVLFRLAFWPCAPAGEGCTAEGDEIDPELGIVEASEGPRDGRMDG